VGRLSELTELSELLARPGVRLVTLVGPGGVGKTRLALAAAELRSDAVFVSLAPVREAALARSTIARAVGLEDETALVDWLRARPILLVLDNCEHLPEAGPAIAELLVAVRDLRVLATSRTPLDLSGEHRYGVAPLPLADATELFRERAAAAGAASRPAARSIEDICRRLDCLPLALELAAAHSDDLPLGQLLLAVGPRDLPDRQRTLHATIEWSCSLLEPAARTLLARLSVFARGCTVEAAEEVCDADLGTLESLVDNSLVDRDRDRFTMLETIREYARERLDRSAEAHTIPTRHIGRLIALAERLEPGLGDPSARIAAALLRDELDEVRVALRFALDHGESELALRLAALLRPLWSYFGIQAEGLRWLEQALARAPQATTAAHAEALKAAGWLALLSDDRERAESLSAQALSEFRRLGDRHGEAVALRNLGTVYSSVGDTARARALLSESVTLLERDDDRLGLAFALNNLGYLERHAGNLGRAGELLSRALELQRSLAASSISLTLGQLGLIALDQNELGKARELLCSALATVSLFALNDPGNIRYGTDGLGGLAALAAREGDNALAGRLWGAVESLEAQLGPQIMHEDRSSFERILDELQDAPEYENGLAAGRTLTLAQALGEALEAYAPPQDASTIAMSSRGR
jgi:predicted ATPase